MYDFFFQILMFKVDSVSRISFADLGSLKRENKRGCLLSKIIFSVPATISDNTTGSTKARQH